MKRTTIIGAATVAATVAASAAIFYTNPANGHSYALTDTTDTWHGAQAQALSYGGNLATVRNAAEEAWLRSTFDPGFLYWIGFTDEASEGTFYWISGEPVTYTNWAPFEPNDFFGEDYTVMNWTESGNWNDLSDAGYHFGIIEVVPEPAHYLAVTGLVSLVAARFLRRKA